MERHLPLSDWRDDAAYRPLGCADRAILAWEWLRRDPAYRRAATAADANHASARAWGLHRFENPSLGAPDARPIWTSAIYDAVLSAHPDPAARASAIDLAGLRGVSSGHPAMPGSAADGRVRLLLGDGWRAIRLDLAPGTGWPSPAALRFTIAGPPRLAPQLLALQRLESLLRTGRFVAALHRREPRAARQVLLIRTADALAAGARQREIAAVVIDPDAGLAAWRIERPDLRLRAQRLVRDARRYAHGGWRRLLSSQAMPG
jgi:hypothetical protein